jgi:uncharacterized iron-regulated membrane protein
MATPDNPLGRKMSNGRNIAVISLLDCINGFIFGLSLKLTWTWVVIGTAVFFLLLCSGLYMIMQKSEAEKRTVTNPITSYDQKGMQNASLIFLLAIGLFFAYLGWIIV